jgi:hypothetical protein
MDGSHIFKPALSRGDIQIIGATTLDEFRTNIETDGALERRFQKVVVDPATKDETLQILRNSKSKYEDYHKVIFSDEVLITCVDLADRYITDREFPDKAFDIIDEVGARSQVDVKMPESIEKLKQEASEIKQMKIDVVKRQNYEQAAELRDKEKKVLNRLHAEKQRFEEEMNINKKDVQIELDDYPIDSEGYPKAPRNTEDYFFQLGAGWYETTPSHRSPDEVQLTGEVYTGQNFDIQTQLQPFTYGQQYLDRFRQFPYMTEGFKLRKIVDNNKSWLEEDDKIRVSRDADFNAYYYADNEKLVLNVKNVDLFLNPAQGLVYDIWDSSVRYDYPIPES